MGERRALRPSTLLADSAWEILLALYAAALEDRPCSLDDLACSGLATAQLLRLIDGLERDGLVATPSTTGPVRIHLTASGLSCMGSFFSSPIDPTQG